VSLHRSAARFNSPTFRRILWKVIRGTTDKLEISLLENVVIIIFAIIIIINTTIIVIITIQFNSYSFTFNVKLSAGKFISLYT
jgi:hypothetical protein